VSDAPHTFMAAGYTVHLSRLDGAWVAEVEGTDLIHVMQAYDDEDIRRPVNLVYDWIDAGMPLGGPSA
jgi:hypothetical protein